MEWQSIIFTKDLAVLDVAARRNLWAKSYEEAYDLIEKLATNEYQDHKPGRSRFSLTDKDLSTVNLPVSLKYEWTQLGQFTRRIDSRDEEYKRIAVELSNAFSKAMGTLGIEARESIQGADSVYPSRDTPPIGN